MKEIFYPVACECMRLAGMQPTPTDGTPALQQELSARFPAYESLARAAIESNDPMPQREWPVGLSKREHPQEIYLGAVSDHLCDALAGPIEAVDRTAIELAILIKWTITMDTARELKDH